MPVVSTARGEVWAVLTDVEVAGGIKHVDDGLTSVAAALMPLLAFPHSASTSAMMSPPPDMESKVRREEMSASKELRLLSPGAKCDSVGKGGTCLSAVLTFPAVTWGAAVSDGVVAALSCTVKLLLDSRLSAVGLSRERGMDLGVRVRSSLMISTLLVRDSMSSGLGGPSSWSSLSFDRNLTLLKRPFSPRRFRATG